MRVLYFDCSMGAAGDMISAGLYELLGDSDKKTFTDKLSTIIKGLGDVNFSYDRSMKGGVTGTHFKVVVNGTEEKSVDVHSAAEPPHGAPVPPQGVPERPVVMPAHHSEERERYLRNHPEANSHTYRRDDANAGAPVPLHGAPVPPHGAPVPPHGAPVPPHGAPVPPHGAPVHAAEAHEHGNSFRDIKVMAAGFPAPPDARENFLAVYKLIAEAESNAHGKPVDEIHFHEVGAKDAVVDIMSVCLLMDMIKPDKVIVSPIRTGYGKVECAHGIIPVPAPATEFLLKDIPVYQGDIEGELCTPTGAALIRHFANEFGDMPNIRTVKEGHGMGVKDYKNPNCVTIILGEDIESAKQDALCMKTDTVCTLECNIDDMTGEALGYAKEALMNCGALDVYTTAISMKKDRPGVLLTVICWPDDKTKIVSDIFRLTSTIGIRERICERYVLDRQMSQVNTQFGQVNVKTVSGYGVSRYKYEYEDLRRIAESKGISIAEAEKLIRGNM